MQKYFFKVYFPYLTARIALQNNKAVKNHQDFNQLSFYEFAHNLSTINMLRQEKQSFSTLLWKKVTDKKYVECALNTQFIQDMKHGILHPQIFGIFMIQDYQYQQEAAILFEKAYQMCEVSSDHYIMGLIEPFKKKYRERVDDHFKKWRLKKFTATRSRACEEYVRVGLENLETYGPKYVFILQYCCRRLWPDLANQIRHFIPLQKNAYKFWIERYQCEEPEKKMSRVLDELFDKNMIDPEICWNLLEQCIICDINFLKEPFDEEFLFLDSNSKQSSNTEISTEEIDETGEIV